MRSSIWWRSSWSFSNNFAKNVVIFGVANSSLSHADNRKIKLLVLGEVSTDGVNYSVGAAGKKLVLTSVKQIQNFA